MHLYNRREDEDGDDDDDDEEEGEEHGYRRSNGGGTHPLPMGFSRPLLPPNSSLLSPGMPAGRSSGHAVACSPPPPPGGGSAFRYRECLKNHAARLGAHVLDGCGEFMPSLSSPPNLDAALACAACGCHRSFHRRAAVDDAPSMHAIAGSTTGSGTMLNYSDAGGKLVPLLLSAPRNHSRATTPAFTLTTVGESGQSLPPSAAAMSAATAMPVVTAGVGGAGGETAGGGKRFRTKFTAEQKGLMKEFGHRIGWRMKAGDDAAIEDFCRRIGVERRVLKVWMHNNKHLAGEQRRCH